MDIRDRLEAAAMEFNAAIAVGKVRGIRKAADHCHATVTAAISEIRAQRPVDRSLLGDAEALLTDIRWGQQTAKFVQGRP